VSIDGIFRHDDDHARTYAAGDTVFKLDDAADCMFVVMSGTVEIRLGGRVLERVTSGGIVGEMALIEDLPRSATVVAVEPTRLSTVDKKRFEFLVQTHPFFATHVMRVLAHRLRQMDKTLQENATAPT
jgi:CRP/FNR family transcriptional regulator, cyclic AMP receptor protein